MYYVTVQGLSYGDVADDINVYGRHNCFKFVPSGKDAKHYIISAETSTSKLEWLTALGIVLMFCVYM